MVEWKELTLENLAGSRPMEHCRAAFFGTGGMVVGCVCVGGGIREPPRLESQGTPQRTRVTRGDQKCPYQTPINGKLMHCPI